MSAPLDARVVGSATGGPSFGLSNRLARVAWGLCWLLLARWTPPPMHRWRVLVLRAFGARIGAGARVYGSARIWLPVNLVLGDRVVIGPRTRLYNQGRITIGDRVTVSQDASLCASSHDVFDRHFQLVLRPITIEDDAWIAAEAFVGPGVRIGQGAVLGARSVAMRDVPAWTICSGNPASPIRLRRFNDLELT